MMVSNENRGVFRFWGRLHKVVESYCAMCLGETVFTSSVEASFATTGKMLLLLYYCNPNVTADWGQMGDTSNAESICENRGSGPF